MIGKDQCAPSAVFSRDRHFIVDVIRWQQWTVAGLQGIRVDGLSGDLRLTFTESDQSYQGRAE